jgi:kynureninase
VVATDTTSINLYKVLSRPRMNIAATDDAARPQASSSASAATSRPTCTSPRRCASSTACTLRAGRARTSSPRRLTAEVAILMLTHVNYRTGAMHDMAAVTAAAHAEGILTVWDLAHSAGAVPVNLTAAKADFAVGCGYKYLNGGPGAPAFVWVNPHHADRFWQPLAGWWGHVAPFAFTPDYQPAPGIARYQCGTQPVISLAALECGVDTVLDAAPLGGMEALRAKSLALTDLFIQLVEERCEGHDLGLATPRVHALRGSQVSLTRNQGAYAIVQALIARGVIGDYRAGDGECHKDILRFGFTPLYIGFADVWNAVEQLKQVLESGEWRRPEFNQKHAVT